MEKVKPRTLSGFMELLPEKQVLMEKMMEEIRSAFKLYGFYALDTPIIEASEVLLAKAGGETEQQIYRFTKGDSDLSLRFDLTVPLAKYVAQNYGQLAFPFRRYQIGKVYRGERAQRGRFREFYQADIDVIGDGELDIINEAEIPAIIYRVFTSLGLRRFRIRVNNRKILNGLFEIMGLSEKAADVMRILDKIDKIGGEKVLELLIEAGVSREAGEKTLEFITFSGNSAEKVGFLEKYRGKSTVFDEGADELRVVAEYLPSFGVPEENFEIDFSIARGLDYYTGTVYETLMLDNPEIGSICSGGRYNNLAEYYTDKKLPGVGISIGLTRLFFVLEDKGYLNEKTGTAPCDALIIPMGGDISHAVAAATILRENGVSVQLHCEDKKLKAKLAYADKLRIPFAVFVGEDEIKSGNVSVKNLFTGEQETLRPEEAAERILAFKLESSAGGVIIDKVK